MSATLRKAVRDLSLTPCILMLMCPTPSQILSEVLDAGLSWFSGMSASNWQERM